MVATILFSNKYVLREIANTVKLLIHVTIYYKKTSKLFFKYKYICSEKRNFENPTINFYLETLTNVCLENVKSNKKSFNGSWFYVFQSSTCFYVYR